MQFASGSFDFNYVWLIWGKKKTQKQFYCIINQIHFIHFFLFFYTFIWSVTPVGTSIWSFESLFKAVRCCSSEDRDARGNKRLRQQRSVKTRVSVTQSTELFSRHLVANVFTERVPSLLFHVWCSGAENCGAKKKKILKINTFKMCFLRAPLPAIMYPASVLAR